MISTSDSHGMIPKPYSLCTLLDRAKIPFFLCTGQCRNVYLLDRIYTTSTNHFPRSPPFDTPLSIKNPRKQAESHNGSHHSLAYHHESSQLRSKSTESLPSVNCRSLRKCRSFPLRDLSVELPLRDLGSLPRGVASRDGTKCTVLVSGIG